MPLHTSMAALSLAGLDWGGDADLFLSGRRVRRADRLFQLQQIHQQLLQVKVKWEEEGKWFNRTRAHRHPHTHNLWSSLKRCYADDTMLCNRQLEHQSKLSRSLKIISVPQAAFISCFGFKCFLRSETRCCEDFPKKEKKTLVWTIKCEHLISFFFVRLDPEMQSSPAPSTR